jgi:hypothetical protein
MAEEAAAALEPVNQPPRLALAAVADLVAVMLFSEFLLLC